jgi:hypothetical protein
MVLCLASNTLLQPLTSCANPCECRCYINDIVPATWFIDFMAMNDKWLMYTEGLRPKIIARARQLTSNLPNVAIQSVTCRLTFPLPSSLSPLGSPTLIKEEKETRQRQQASCSSSNGRVLRTTVITTFVVSLAYIALSLWRRRSPP